MTKPDTQQRDINWAKLIDTALTAPGHMGDTYNRFITGAVKGEGSVNLGIQLVQQQQVWLTTRSLNAWKEVRNYLWKKDKRTEQPLNVPVDLWNHAMDASRYAISDVLAGKHYGFRVRTA
jgi:hypothetical protein